MSGKVKTDFQLGHDFQKAYCSASDLGVPFGLRRCGPLSMKYVAVTTNLAERILAVASAY